LVMRWPRVVAHIACHAKLPDEDLTNLVQLPEFQDNEAVLSELLEYARMSPLSGHPVHSNSWVCIDCKRRIPWQISLDHLKERHPDILPDDYTESEHVHHFDRYFALHLDATGTSLFEPIRVNVKNPAQSFREAFSLYHQLYGNSGGHLDAVSQQMAQVFLAGPSNTV